MWKDRFARMLACMLAVAISFPFTITSTICNLAKAQTSSAYRSDHVFDHSVCNLTACQSLFFKACGRHISCSLVCLSSCHGRQECTELGFLGCMLPPPLTEITDPTPQTLNRSPAKHINPNGGGGSMHPQGCSRSFVFQLTEGLGIRIAWWGLLRGHP